MPDTPDMADLTGARKDPDDSQGAPEREDAERPGVAEPPAPYTEVSETMGMKIPSIGPTRMRCLQKLRESPDVLPLLDTAPAGGR